MIGCVADDYTGATDVAGGDSLRQLLTGHLVSAVSGMPSSYHSDLSVDHAKWITPNG
jgi:uncharacterized protein YgbK (DUF1537 family)